jgi:hypothetical protein
MGKRIVSNVTPGLADSGRAVRLAVGQPNVGRRRIRSMLRRSLWCSGRLLRCPWHEACFRKPQANLATRSATSRRPPPKELNRGEAGDLDACCGIGAGDHDVPYKFGHRPSSAWTYPFTMLQYSRLLVLRGRALDGEFDADRTRA